MTTMGPVKVERALYKDGTDPEAHAVVVLERRLGIIGGFWMPEAAKQAAWVVSRAIALKVALLMDEWVDGSVIA